MKVNQQAFAVNAEAQAPPPASNNMRRLLTACEYIGVIHKPGVVGWIVSVGWIAFYLGILMLIKKKTE